MSGAPAVGGREAAPTRGSAVKRHAGWRRFLAARDGAVAVEFALVTAVLLVPFLVMVADSVQRITGERRLQEAMHLVSMTIASDPERLEDRAALLALATDVAGPGDLELEIASVCYCPDAQGLSAAPIACQTPCSGRLTFHSLELTQATPGFLPFSMPFDEQDDSSQRVSALVLAP